MISNFLERRSAKKDIASGLTLAIESVPDRMAVGTLAAINPIAGRHRMTTRSPHA